MAASGSRSAVAVAASMMRALAAANGSKSATTGCAHRVSRGDRQCHGKQRSSTLAVAMRFDAPGMQLDDLVRNRKPQTQPLFSRMGAARLPVAFENVGHSLGTDASPGVTHADALRLRRSGCTQP